MIDSYLHQPSVFIANHIAVGSIFSQPYSIAGIQAHRHRRASKMEAFL